MKKSKLAILIGFMPNPRIFKRIALESELYEVHLICWNRGENMIPHKDQGNCVIHQIDIPASSNPLKRMIPYMRFKKAATAFLEEIRPDVIHSQMVDMLKIAVNYAKRQKRKVRLIYEIADLHRLLVDQQRSPVKKIVQSYLRKEDIRCSRKIDLLIVTSKRYYEIYFKSFVPREKVLYFPNVPNLSAFKSYERHNGKDETFTVGYIGGVRYKDQCRILIEAAKRLDMPLLMAGFENGEPEIEPLCREYKNGTWVGGFDFQTQIAELYGKCDVIYSVYNADMANVRVALPNKLYEAVYCGLPLIAARNTHLGEILKDWGVGEMVDYHQPDELTEVLGKMRDDHDYYDRLVKNCAAHREEIDLDLYNDRLRKILAGWHQNEQ